MYHRYNSPATNDVSQVSVIPRTLTKSPEHVRKPSEDADAPWPRVAEHALQKTILAERPNAPLVEDGGDASLQIRKWPLASLRRSSEIAAKPQSAQPRDLRRLI